MERESRRQAARADAQRREYRRLAAERGEADVAREDSIIGAIGVLIVATRGQAGPGEVLIKVRGGSEAYIAWSAEPLPRGTSVLVIESRGTRAVDVSAWADPLDPLSKCS
jgi:membrane protein implicated in regulation of membrane protease activity